MFYENSPPPDEFTRVCANKKIYDAIFRLWPHRNGDSVRQSFLQWGSMLTRQALGFANVDELLDMK